MSVETVASPQSFEIKTNHESVTEIIQEQKESQQTQQILKQNYLLDDHQVQEFISEGYMIIQPNVDSLIHKEIYNDISTILKEEGNPGNNILARVPQITEIFENDVIKASLTSLLGLNYVMHPHRHCHVSQELDGEFWRKNSYWGNDYYRSHRLRWIVGMYFPQEVTMDLAPISVLPGTQYYSLQKENLKSNWTKEVPETTWNTKESILTCQTGSVLLMHYDLWHRTLAFSGKTNRFALKFSFFRTEEPIEPTWNFSSAEWDFKSLLPQTSTVDKIISFFKPKTDNDFQVSQTFVDSRKPILNHLWQWMCGRKAIPEIRASTPQDINSVEDVVPYLIKDFQNSAREADVHRVKLAYALGQQYGSLITETLLEILEKASDEESNFISRNIMYALISIGSPAVPEILETLELPNLSESAKSRLCFVLGEITNQTKYEKVVLRLIDFCEDNSSKVRMYASMALGNLVLNTSGNVSLQHEIISKLGDLALKDQSPNVREWAMFGLLKTHSSAAFNFYRQALKDKSRNVIGYALEGLRRLNSPEANQILINFLMNTRWCYFTSKNSNDTVDNPRVD